MMKDHLVAHVEALPEFHSLINNKNDKGMENVLGDPKTSFSPASLLASCHPSVTGDITSCHVVMGTAQKKGVI